MKCAQCDQTLYLGRCRCLCRRPPDAGRGVSAQTGRRPKSALPVPGPSSPAKSTEQVTKPTELGQEVSQVDEIKPATDRQIEEAVLMARAGFGETFIALRSWVLGMAARIRQDQARIAGLEAERRIAEEYEEKEHQRAEQAKAQVAALRHEITGLEQGRDNMKTMWGLAHEAANKAEAQRDEALAHVAVLGSALRGLLNIRDDSQGIAGYHLNGDIADWDEFEEVAAAEAALANLPDAAQALLDERDRLRVADDACRAIHRLVQDMDPGAYGVAADVMAELGDWLKVEAQEAPHA